MTTRLEFIDWFLKSLKDDRECKIRARFFVIYVLSAIALTFALFSHSLLYGHFSPAFVALGLVSIGLKVIFLMLGRLQKSMETLALIYFLHTLVFFAIDAVRGAENLLYPYLQLMPLIVMFSFLCLTRKIYRLTMVIAVASTSIWIIRNINNRFTDVRIGPYSVQYFETIDIGTLYRNGLVILCMCGYVTLRNLSNKESNNLIAQRVDTIKIEEISLALAWLSEQFLHPLRRSENIAKKLQAKSPLVDATLLTSLEDDVRKLVKISQNLGWVYKAYRNENVAELNVLQFCDQAELMILAKLRDTHWKFVFDVQDSEEMISGPLPSVMILITSVLDLIVRSNAHSNTKHITLSFAVEKSHFQCLIQFNGQWLDRYHFNPNRLLKSKVPGIDFVWILIEELIDNSRATLNLTQEGTKHTLSISGPWCHGSKI